MQKFQPYRNNQKALIHPHLPKIRSTSSRKYTNDRPRRQNVDYFGCKRNNTDLTQGFINTPCAFYYHNTTAHVLLQYRSATYTTICRAVGIGVVENSLVSDRVRNPCARKIRNLGTLYKLIQSSTGAECKAQVQTTRPSKRLLDTLPGSSPCQFPASQKASRKSTTDEAQQVKDSIDSKLNVDNLLTDGSFEVKVVIVDGTGKPTAEIPQDVECKQIVLEVCNKNWQA